MKAHRELVSQIGEDRARARVERVDRALKRLILVNRFAMTGSTAAQCATDPPRYGRHYAISRYTYLLRVRCSSTVNLIDEIYHVRDSA
jgi:hypothetical protein